MPISNINIAVGNKNEGASLAPSASPVKKNIFVFDKNQCVGCHSCVVACVNENGFDSRELWRTISSSNSNHFPGLALFHLSLACNHCDDAPCMKSCPSQAFYFDKKTGAVLHDTESCIGCKYCTWTCPYDAPKYSSYSGIIEKCNFCDHRIVAGLKPACANLCPTGALDFSFEALRAEDAFDLSDTARKTGPSIKIIELENPSPPKIDHSLFKDQLIIPPDISSHKNISAIKEWPLIIFTILSSFMLGAYLAKTELQSTNYLSWFISGSGVFAAILSLLHLGKKTRAWKAIINIENSWLSREILFFVFFFAALIIDFFVFDIPDIIPIINGVLLLFSIDMIYRPLMSQWKIKLHSAQTLFIAVSIWLALSQYLYLFILLSGLRMAIYFYKKRGLSESFTVISGLVAGLMILGACLAFLTPYFWIGIPLILIGEIIGRIEFYNELRIPVLFEK